MSNREPSKPKVPKEKEAKKPIDLSKLPQMSDLPFGDAAASGKKSKKKHKSKSTSKTEGEKTEKKEKREKKEKSESSKKTSSKSRGPKTEKVWVLKLAPKNPDGKTIYPVHLDKGSIEITSIGEISTKENYHSESYIWPIGFKR